MTHCWSEVSSSAIEQGDLIAGCEMPRVPDAAFEQAAAAAELTLEKMDVIVLTQTCQIENNKLKNAVVCRVATVAKFNEQNGGKLGKGFWTNARGWHDDRLHLLHQPTDASSFSDLLVVDFRDIFTPPISYLRTFVAGRQRWRLQSPYVEHLAQRFGYYFMKVALPMDLPPHS